jgi:uncharacterized OB-fold protein
MMASKQTLFLAEQAYRMNKDGSPYLVGGKCRACKHTFFPIREFCPACLSDEFDENPLSTKGIIYSCAKVVAPPAGFVGPYVLGYADFSDHRIFGMIVGDNPKIGSVVELEIGQIRETEEAIYKSYRFKVIKKEGGDA